MSISPYYVFEKFSIETWEKLTVITPLTTYLKFNEEGFTLDLVYIANKFANTFVLLDDSIKKPEKETGADFFWKIVCGDKVIKLAVQAKKANKIYSGYSSIKKKISKGPYTQIEILMRESKLAGYEPYYFFYNGKYKNTKIAADKYVHTDEVYRSQYYWGKTELGRLGCTVLSADKVDTLGSGYNFHNVSKHKDTRSLQQFLKEKCPCILEPKTMYSTIGKKQNPTGEDKDIPNPKFEEIDNSYKILSSNELNKNSRVVKEAIKHFNDVKQEIKSANLKNTEYKINSPKAIMFTML